MFDRRPDEELLPDGPARRKAGGAADIHFASSLVTCVPEREDEIMSIIRDYPQTDAERGPYAGKLIVTMETERLSDVTEFLDRVERLPGVMHAAVVYHHAEPADQLDQEIELDDAGEPVSQPIGVTP